MPCSGASSTVDHYPCDVDGNVYNISTVSDTEPDEPENGEIWADTSGSPISPEDIREIASCDGSVLEEPDAAALDDLLLPAT